MLELPDKWAHELSRSAETGMGYQVVTVFLNDGRRFEQVAVLGSRFVTQVRGHPFVPFSVDDIQSIRITHDKWHFSQEP
jgi:hypothetical protein